MAVEIRTYKGSSFDARTFDMLVEAQRLCLLEDPTINIQPTQGSFQPSTSFSFDTHAGPAVDLSIRFMTTKQKEIVNRAMRTVGFAYWERAELPGVWPNHGHGIPIPPAWEWAKNSIWPRSAWEQCLSYRAGYDGLATPSRDLYWRPKTIQTWEEYKANNQEKDDDTMAGISEERLAEIVRNNTREGFKQVMNNPALMSELSQKLTKHLLNNPTLMSELRRKLK